ncbi:hypothetical protein DICVIV_08141, partial [Dictyocaulus viviparus]
RYPLQILLATDTWLPKFSRRRLHQGAQFVGVGVLIINLIGSVFIEYTWDACFLCAVESLETSCRGSGIGSCSLMARIGAILTPYIETKGVNLDDVIIDSESIDSTQHNKCKLVTKVGHRSNKSTSSTLPSKIGLLAEDVESKSLQCQTSSVDAP